MVLVNWAILSLKVFGISSLDSKMLSLAPTATNFSSVLSSSADNFAVILLSLSFKMLSIFVSIVDRTVFLQSFICDSNLSVWSFNSLEIMLNVLM